MAESVPLAPAFAQAEPVPRRHLARLRRVLETHRGAAPRITARDLTVILEIQDPTGKTIRELVNALIDEGLPVGSINAEQAGYFVCETQGGARGQRAEPREPRGRHPRPCRAAARGVPPRATAAGVAVNADIEARERF